MFSIFTHVLEPVRDYTNSEPGLPVVPPSVSVALKIALRSSDHHGITITLAYSS